MASTTLGQIYSDDECSDNERDRDDESDSGSEQDSGSESGELEAPGTTKTTTKTETTVVTPVLPPPPSAASVFNSAAPAAGAGAGTVALAGTPHTFGSSEQMALMVAEVIRSAMVASNIRPSVVDQSKFVTVKFSATGSLTELSKMADAATGLVKLRSNNPELVKMMGGAEAPVRAGFVVAFGNTFPVALALNADHWGGLKHKRMLVDTTACMLELPASSHLQLATPQAVYECQPSVFRAAMAKAYPNVTEESIGTDTIKMAGVAEFRDFTFLRKDSATMAGVTQEIELATKKAAAKGEAYTGPQPVYHEKLEMFQVADSLAKSAINLLKSSFAETHDSINVERALHLTVQRSSISAKAVDTSKSAQAESPWLNDHGLPMSLKSGHTVENQKNKPGEVWVAMKFQIA